MNHRNNHKRSFGNNNNNSLDDPLSLPSSSSENNTNSQTVRSQIAGFFLAPFRRNRAGYGGDRRHRRDNSRHNLRADATSDMPFRPYDSPDMHRKARVDSPSSPERNSLNASFRGLSKGLRNRTSKLQKLSESISDGGNKILLHPFTMGTACGCVFSHAYQSLAYYIVSFYLCMLLTYLVYLSIVKFSMSRVSKQTALESFDSSENDLQNTSKAGEEEPLLGSKGSVPQSPKSKKSFVKLAEKKKKTEPSKPAEDLSPKISSKLNQNAASPPLNKIVVCDRLNKSLIPINQIHDTENDHFDGKCLLMFRPPDDSLDLNSVEFFKGKQRRFEFQFQGRIKVIPTGQIYMAMELSYAPQFGMFQKTIVNASLRFIQKFNKGFHYKTAGANEVRKGKNEFPHLAFPVETCMDRLVVTKPGDIPPKLGHEIFEDPEEMKERKKGNRKVDWNLNDIYTLSVYSSYCDWGKWDIRGLPGARPFGISSMIGPQPVVLTFYSLSDYRASQEHFHDEKQIYADVEIGHRDRTKESIDKVLRDLNSGEPILSTIVDEDDDDNDDEMAQNQIDKYLDKSLYLQNEKEILLLGDDRFDSAEDSNRPLEYVGSGGGYAVMSSNSTNRFVLEKVNRSRQSRNKESNDVTICDGDIVVLKVVNSDGSKLYATTHRGWWIKFVKERPRHNGFFVLQACTSLRVNNDLIRRGGPILLGSSFILRHKRWSNYEVGINVKVSADFGGRMLGLRKIDDSSHLARNKEIADPVLFPDHENDDAPEDQKQWLDPFHFICKSPTSIDEQSIQKTSEESTSEKSSRLDDPFFENLSSTQIHVAAWLEVMDRSKRTLRGTYAVRITTNRNDTSESRVILRTAHDLLPILDLSQSVARQSTSICNLKYGEDHNESEDDSDESDGELDGSVILESALTDLDEGVEIVLEDNNEDDDDENRVPVLRRTLSDLDVRKGAVELTRLRSHSWDGTIEAGPLDDLFVIEGLEHSARSKSDISEAKKRWLRKPTRGMKKAGKTAAVQSFRVTKKIGKGSVAATKMIGKGSAVATKKIGRGTFIVSKKIGKGSYVLTKKVGKGTVNVISKGVGKGRNKPQGRHPPKEPKLIRRSAIGKKLGKDNHALVEKALKLPKRKRQKSRVLGSAASVERATRCIQGMNNVLASVGLLSSTSEHWKVVANAFSGIDKSEGFVDFLRGDAVDLGVRPKPGLSSSFVVCRALWDMHWKEELVALYEEGFQLCFYSPLSHEPIMSIDLSDVRNMKDIEHHPTLGKAGLGAFIKIECTWKAHYLLFPSQNQMNLFKEKVELFVSKSLVGLNETHILTSSNPLELYQINQWAPLSVESGKEARRVVLNSRLMAFDAPSLLPSNSDNFSNDACKAVEDLLSCALDLTNYSLEERPQDLIAFLNKTCSLRQLSFRSLDLNSEEAMCIYINLYHCLTQHILIVNGCPTKGVFSRLSIIRHMRCFCYEIGEDVFSLAELDFIIRGSMTLPVHAKLSPYILPPKNLLRPYQKCYGLMFGDHRINFVLNNGMKPNSNRICIFTPNNLDSQINEVSKEFMLQNLKVDLGSRRISLPKVLEVYRSDFDGQGTESFWKECLPFCDKEQKKAICACFAEGSSPAFSISFHSYTWKYHSSFVLHEIKDKSDSFQTEDI